MPHRKRKDDEQCSVDLLQLLVELAAQRPHKQGEIEVLLEAARLPDLLLSQLVRKQILRTSDEDFARIIRDRILRCVETHGTLGQKAAAAELRAEM